MPTIVRVALVVGLSLLLPTLALAQNPYPVDSRGQALLQQCQGDAGNSLYCMGKLMGPIDTHALVGVAGAPRPFCLPPEVTLGQVRLIVIRYLERHPERLHEHWASLATQALTQAWGERPALLTTLGEPGAGESEAVCGPDGCAVPPAADER